MKAELNSKPDAPTTLDSQVLGVLLAAQSMTEATQSVVSRLMDDHEIAKIDLLLSMVS